MMQESRAESAARINIAVPVRIEAWAVSASSGDQAYEQGLARALDLWPTAEGWFGHTAKLAEIHLQPHVPTIAADTLPERIM
jgi:hypothetical protein